MKLLKNKLLKLLEDNVHNLLLKLFKSFLLYANVKYYARVQKPEYITVCGYSFVCSEYHLSNCKLTTIDLENILALLEAAKAAEKSTIYLNNNNIIKIPIIIGKYFKQLYIDNNPLNFDIHDEKITVDGIEVEKYASTHLLEAFKTPNRILMYTAMLLNARYIREWKQIATQAGGSPKKCKPTKKSKRNKKRSNKNKHKKHTRK